MQGSPLVSVVLPAFNAARYLRAATESILSQSYDNLELILLDDGSTDETPEIVHSLARKDLRVRPVSRKNRGLIQTLNEGLELARGSLVARMDADDVAHPDRLSRQVAAFVENPRLGMCGTGCDIAKRNRVLRRTIEPVFETCDLATLAQFFTVFIHPTVMFNREVLGETLRYDPQYPHAEDFDLFRRIAQAHPCRLISDSLLVYRLHEQSVTMRHRNEMRQTHLRIVSENLGAMDFAGDFEVLNAFGRDPNASNANGTGIVWRELGDQIEGRGRLASSYAAGRMNLFYFLYDMLKDRGEPAITSRFLDAANGWALIRRREAIALRCEGFLKGVTAFTLGTDKMVDEMVFDLRSKPIDSKNARDLL